MLNFELRLTVPNQASAPARALEPDIVHRLAQFFPEATPVRIPIRLSRANNIENGEAKTGAISWSLLQETVIEFGTPHEVLFLVKHPLEFADLVLVESRDGALRAEASVVAVQYHPDRAVVAARFLKNVPNWIVKS
ncbi:MAG TPA: hypothetical protein VL983_09450 [Terriglobales bacterium]|nr:hypothetical protein [Terriglobales bacterium]